MRAVKRHGGSRIPLPAPASLDLPLGEVIGRRRSQRAFADRPSPSTRWRRCSTRATASRGCSLRRTNDPRSRSGRSRPAERCTRSSSMPQSLRVDGLEPGLYHFDPLCPWLEVLRTSLAQTNWPRCRRTRRSPLRARARLHRRDLRADTVQVRSARLPVRSARGGPRGPERHPRCDRPRPGRGSPRRVLRPTNGRVSRSRRRERVDALRDRGRTGSPSDVDLRAQRVAVGPITGASTFLLLSRRALPAYVPAAARARDGRPLAHPGRDRCARRGVLAGSRARRPPSPRRAVAGAGCVVGRVRDLALALSALAVCRPLSSPALRSERRFSSEGSSRR